MYRLDFLWLKEVLCIVVAEQQQLFKRDVKHLRALLGTPATQKVSHVYLEAQLWMPHLIKGRSRLHKTYEYSQTPYPLCVLDSLQLVQAMLGAVGIAFMKVASQHPRPSKGKTHTRTPTQSTLLPHRYQ